MLQGLQVYTLEMLQHLKIPLCSSGCSIGAHVLGATKQPSRPTLSVENLLGAHSIDDSIWGDSNPCDVSVDTANSKEVMAGSHITKQRTFKFPGFFQRELLNVTSYTQR